MSNLRKLLRLKSLGDQSSKLSSAEVADNNSRGYYYDNLILGSCAQCGHEAEMSSIPMGAHAAFKVRDQQDGGCGGGGGRQPGQSFFQKPAIANELPYNPPAQYNGKLMNSIWGMYNRYSVHNIKSHIAFDKA